MIAYYGFTATAFAAGFIAALVLSGAARPQLVQCLIAGLLTALLAAIIMLPLLPQWLTADAALRGL